MSQPYIILVEIPERQERDDTLRHTMNIDGIRAIVKIPRCAVLPEKVRSVEFKTPTNARLKLRCFSVSANRLQRAQVVSGVEVVNPSLFVRLAIVPCAVFV